MKLTDKAQAAMERIIKRFEGGDISPIIEMTRIRLPEDAPANKWSFSNQVYAFAQTNSLDCRGYRQWQSVERQVRKGEKSALIFGPILVDKREDGEKTGDKRLVGFKGIPVFAYHQTDGNPLPEYEVKDPPPLLDVAKRMGIAVKWQPLIGCYGSADVDGNEIRVGVQEWRTFFHELAHACHAKLGGKLRGGQQADQETIAEFTACVLAQIYGQDYTGNAWDYISFYNPDDPIKAVMAAVKTVGEVIALIEQNGGDE